MLAVCMVHNGDPILAAIAPDLDLALALARLCPRGKTWIQLLSDAAAEQIRTGKIAVVQ